MKVIEIVLTNIGVVVLAAEFYIIIGLRRIFTRHLPYSLSDFIEHRVDGRKLLFG